MTKEEKQLLLKDLCARLPYEVILLSPNNKITYQTDGNTAAELLIEEGWKPYLRPLDSITEEEEKDFNQIFELELKALEDTTIGHSIESAASSVFMIDFYNKNHFDYRGLIPKGLAVEVTKDNNPYEN